MAIRIRMGTAIADLVAPKMDIASGGGGGGEGQSPAQLLNLLTWLSPAFPVGGFAWSHGLETAIREGQVGDRATLVNWIATLVDSASGWNDLVLFREAYAAARSNDGEHLEAVAELAVALAGTAERRAETLALGAAFAAASAPWLTDGAENSPEGASEPDDPLLPAPAIAYPVAVARLSALNGIAPGDALLAYANGFAANLVSVAVRLVPLGQSDGVRALKALEPVLIAAAEGAAHSTLDDLGSAGLTSDIAAMRHETLQPRLFRS
ncbi:urease accessory protein UreF [Mangrovicella endophytica]|uniref:urease accessory protein UreF n=1 Tax=Mangrovicella endophytica TaxID=2066697 RepID=UPI001FE242D8|nr:urease accessory UreF family protein [Mangrovicella endophytica]